MSLETPGLLLIIDCTLQVQLFSSVLPTAFLHGYQAILPVLLAMPFDQGAA
uniref:Uncharacterized protein n=1 Tax=Arundo donax TaxID=35708 RepID=A0A0A9H2M7_ARUDO